jgi:hypothetical protein
MDAGVPSDPTVAGPSITNGGGIALRAVYAVPLVVGVKWPLGDGACDLAFSAGELEVSRRGFPLGGAGGSPLAKAIDGVAEVIFVA